MLNVHHMSDLHEQKKTRNEQNMVRWSGVPKLYEEHFLKTAHPISFISSYIIQNTRLRTNLLGIAKPVRPLFSLGQTKMCTVTLLFPSNPIQAKDIFIFYLLFSLATTLIFSPQCQSILALRMACFLSLHYSNPPHPCILSFSVTPS